MKFETRNWTTAKTTPAVRTAGSTSTIRFQPASTTIKKAGMMMEKIGSCRPTMAESASVTGVWSAAPCPMMGAVSRPRVTIGMPIDPKATGAVLASSASTAALIGSKPRLARIAAEIATGAPKPAMPSIRAPKQNATSSAWTRRSPVSRVRERRITSKSPLAMVRLWKKTAFSTIQLIGHNPFAIPSVVAETSSPNGIPQTSAASTAADSIAVSADIHAGSLRTASMTNKTYRGMPATIAERRMLPPSGWYT